MNDGKPGRDIVERDEGEKGFGRRKERRKGRVTLT